MTGPVQQAPWVPVPVQYPPTPGDATSKPLPATSALGILCELVELVGRGELTVGSLYIGGSAGLDSGSRLLTSGLIPVACSAFLLTIPFYFRGHLISLGI